MEKGEDVQSEGERAQEGESRWCWGRTDNEFITGERAARNDGEAYPLRMGDPAMVSKVRRWSRHKELPQRARQAAADTGDVVTDVCINRHTAKSLSVTRQLHSHPFLVTCLRCW